MAKEESSGGIRSRCNHAQKLLVAMLAPLVLFAPAYGVINLLAGQMRYPSPPGTVCLARVEAFDFQCTWWLWGFVVLVLALFEVWWFGGTKNTE